MYKERSLSAMLCWRNEYEKATEISTISSAGRSSFNIIRRSGGSFDYIDTANILVSGYSPMKLNLLISLMDKMHTLPIIIITDSQRSRLATQMQNLANANFSFVNHSGESAFYNFLRHKNVPEMLRFFSQIAAENGLFGHRQAESELLLRCILQLSVYSTNVFNAVTDNRLTGEFLLREINRQFQQGRLSDAQKNSLIATVNSSVTAAQNVSMAFYDIFFMMNNMHGFSFSIQDIIERKRRVCFCIDGNIAVRNKCWYLTKMIAYDLNDCLGKSDESFLLVLDISNKDKLALFSDIMGVRRVKIIMNVENAEYLVDNFSVSNFRELYLFSHPDINSAKYWSEYFATHRVAEYTYSSNQNRINKYPLLPFHIGSIFGESSEGTSTSYRMIDKPVFEINEIRELGDSEFIYYNYQDKKPTKFMMR